MYHFYRESTRWRVYQTAARTKCHRMETGEVLNLTYVEAGLPETQTPCLSCRVIYLMSRKH